MTGLLIQSYFIQNLELKSNARSFSNEYNEQDSDQTFNMDFHRVQNGSFSQIFRYTGTKKTRTVRLDRGKLDATYVIKYLLIRFGNWILTFSVAYISPTDDVGKRSMNVGMLMITSCGLEK